MVVIQDRFAPDWFWVGTQRGLERFDRRTRQFTHYADLKTSETGTPNVTAGVEVDAVWQDDTGLLWLGTAAGLATFDPSDGVWRDYHDAADPSAALTPGAPREGPDPGPQRGDVGRHPGHRADADRAPGGA